MRFDILTLFPGLIEAVLGESIIGRARENKIIDIHTHNIRDFSHDKHRRVDDTPYGGGMGMLMGAEPIYECFDALVKELGKKPHLVYVSPQGRLFTEDDAKRLSQMDNVAILCGHYEGIDRRIVDLIVDEEISIGDYVLTGGEIPACVIVDAASRLLPGVLADSECYEKESIYRGILEEPQYTRPAEFMGMKVPDVLISGDHEKIEKWRKEAALELTRKNRPDLL